MNSGVAAVVLTVRSKKRVPLESTAKSRTCPASGVASLYSTPGCMAVSRADSCGPNGGIGIVCNDH